MALGNHRSRRGTNSHRSLDTVATRPAGRPEGHRSPPKKSRGKSALGNVVVMTLAGGLIATMALPAYAFAPEKDKAGLAASQSAQRTKSGAQDVSVDHKSQGVTVSRDTVTATSRTELAAAAEAAAAAKRAEVSSQMSALSGSGRSVSDLLASPPFPTFDLASVYNVALGYQGTPYVYGGASPSGFDCSGFTMYVYAQFGVSMPHSSDGQAAMGTPIAEADALPGDLVIMPGHIGFYAGGGNILHSPKPGAVVRVQPIWDDGATFVRVGI